jgi:hypothetical protein
MLEVIEEYGDGGTDSMTHLPNMLKQVLEANGIELSKATNDQVKEGKKTVCNKFLAALMLIRANRARYKGLKRSMKENFVTGTSTYPESPEAILRILNAYRPPAGWNKRRQEAGAVSKEGAMFAQSKGGNNSLKSRQTCHKCGKQGHMARECPEKEEKHDQMHAPIEEEQEASKEDPDHGENIFVQKKEGGGVNKNWVLLNSQSTVSQVSNPALLSNIRKAKNQGRIWERDSKTQPPRYCKRAFAKQSEATSQGDVQQPRTSWGFPSAH